MCVTISQVIYIYFLSIWFVLPIGNLVRRCRSLRYLLRRDNEADNQGVLFLYHLFFIEVGLSSHWVHYCRLTGVGVHPGWLCQWFGPGCADFVFACRIVKVLSLSLWWLPRSQAVSTFKNLWGVGKSASSSSVCRKLFKQANLVTSLC